MKLREPTRMRPSLTAVLALIAGMTLASAFGTVSLLPGMAVLAAGLSCFLSPRLRETGCLIGFCAAGILLQTPGNLTLEASQRSVRQVDQLPGRLVQVTGVIDGVPRVSPTGTSILLAQGAMLEKAGSSRRIPAQVYVRVSSRLTVPGLASAIDGDRISVAGRLVPLPDDPMAGTFESWLHSQGAACQVIATLAEVDASERSPFARYRAAMAAGGNRIEKVLRGNLSTQNAAMLSAMMLGRTGWLTPEQREAFQRSGLMHLFAVSGLHAGIAGALLALIASALGAGPRPRAIIVIAGLFLFCTLTGFRVSAMRASLLVAVFFLQPLVRRQVDPVGTLSSLALILILLKPRVLWETGFQLSFLCAMTIAVAGPGAVALEEWAGRSLLKGRWSLNFLIRAAQLLYITTCIQLALAPFLASMTGEVSLIAPLANALVLPALPFILGGAFVSAGIDLLLPGAGELAWGVLDVLLSAVGRVAALFSGLSVSSINVPAWPPWLAGLWYIALLSGRWVRLRPRFTPLDGAVSATGCIAFAAVLALWMPRGEPKASLMVEFLDVGQGDAILVRTPEQTMLVDTGPPEGGRLMSLLEKRSVDTIDLLVLTHADADHVGGAQRLLEQFPVGQILVGGSLADTEVWHGVAETVQWMQTPVITVRRGAEIELAADVTAHVLHPTAEFTEAGDDRNDGSVVLNVKAGDVSFLLTGDAEQESEQEMLVSLDDEDLRCTVLKAGHHGSRSSSGALFLSAVQPAHVVMSCGRDNRYGHPAPDVLERIEAAGADVWRTDRQGTVGFFTDGTKLTVRVERASD